MPTEKVLSDEILRDARKKAEQTLAQAEREAEAILGAAAKDAEATVQKALDAARRRADAAAQATLATVVQETHRNLLEAQEGELAKLFDAARARLADREAYDYPAVLAGLAANAMASICADQVVIELAEADRAIAADSWLGEVRRRVGRDVSISVSPQAAPIDGGVIVRSADGRLLYDNSFAARLRRLAPVLRRELAAKVFAEKNP
jgi:vacuolar-type H+-ATPase subunit E/Vma4